MRQFLAFICLAVILYGIWQALQPDHKTAVARFLKKHVPAVCFILLLALAGLTWAMYFSSVSFF